jgi:hypothetical protein
VRINRNHDPIIGFPRHRKRHQPLLASTQWEKRGGRICRLLSSPLKDTI